MSALTALRPGRTIGLIQRPRRKQHLAVIHDGASVWDTLGSCRLAIPTDGTVFTAIIGATVGTTSAQDADVCVHCLHLIAFAALLEQVTVSTSRLKVIA